MREATEREEQFFERVEQHPAVQLVTAFCALFGFSVLFGFVVTGGSGVLTVVKTVVLIAGGMLVGYAIRAITGGVDW